MIIADTGFWLALLDERDRWHVRATSVLRQLSEGLMTTTPVVTEVCYLLQRQCGQDAAVAFLRSHGRGAFRLFDPGDDHLARAGLLMKQYAELPMDFADASLVILAEHLGHGRILSTDQRDFGTYRWKQHHPFENLLA